MLPQILAPALCSQLFARKQYVQFVPVKIRSSDGGDFEGYCLVGRDTSLHFVGRNLLPLS